MDSSCKTCEFARYTSHDEKVGCGYWSAEYFLENGEHISEDKRNSEMFASGLKQIWLGWVFLKRRPEKKETEFLGEGIMTNFCVITNEGDVCAKYERRKKLIV